jgi:CRP/FNR family transcriptional regulator, cyclic AMP receptor protein
MVSNGGGLKYRQSAGPHRAFSAAKRAYAARTPTLVTTTAEGDMAPIDEKLELLKHVPLFKDLSGHDLQQVGQLAEEVDVPAGQVLTRQGAPGSEFFVIVDGAVRIDIDGNAVRTLERGEFLGEIALVDDGPRTATATTTVPSKLFVLGRREFRALMDDYPSIEHSVMHCLVERLRAADHTFAH